MKIIFSNFSFDSFIYRLLKHRQQFKACFEFILSSNSIIQKEKLKNILALYNELNYTSCYNEMLTCHQEEKFYSKLALILLVLEEFQVRTFISSLNNNYHIAVNRKISFFKTPHREKVINFFNLNINNFPQYKNESSIYKDLINLLEYYKYINIINCDKTNLGFCFSELFNNSSCADKKDYNNVTLKYIKKFYDENVLYLPNVEGYVDEDSNIKKKLNISEDSKNNEIDDDELIAKLNYIQASINTIDFNTENLVKEDPRIEGPNIGHQGISQEENENSPKKNDENEDFFLKLKVFNVLKKFYLNRKKNKHYYLKKDELKRISKNFYENMLKSKVFFGFVVLSRRKRNYNLIKENYIDKRIKELSKTLIDSLVFAYNKAKTIQIYLKQRRRKLKRKLFDVLKEKVNYKKTYNNFLLSQICNNPFALDFMLLVCDKAKNRVIAKRNFFSNYETLQEKKLKSTVFKIIKAFFAALKENNEKFKSEKEKFAKIQEMIAKVYLFNTLKKKLSKIDFFMKKLFFMRYYIQHFKKKKESKKIAEKNQLFLHSIVLPREFKNFIGNVSKKILHKKQISSIIKSNVSKKPAKSAKVKFDLREEPKNSNDTIEIYKQNLKRSALDKWIRFHTLKSKERKFKQKIRHEQIERFFRRSKLKTIKSLIVQGIREKIKDYHRIYFLQLMFHCSYEKIKLEKGCLIRNRYLKLTLLRTLQRNVKRNYDEMKQNTLFFFRLFKARLRANKDRALLSKALKNRDKLKLAFNVFISNLIIKKKQKLLIKKKKENLAQLQVTNSIRNFYRKNELHLKNNLIRKTKLFYSKIFIKSLLKKHSLKTIAKKQKKKLLVDLWKGFIKNITEELVTKTLKESSRVFLLKKSFKWFTSRVAKSSLKESAEIKKEVKLRGLLRKYLSKELLDSLVISYKVKSLQNGTYELYVRKLKKKIFGALNKNYINKLKYSILKRRFEQHLIINSISNMTQVAIKRKTKLNK